MCARGMLLTGISGHGCVHDRVNARVNDRVRANGYENAHDHARARENVRESESESVNAHDRHKHHFLAQIQQGWHPHLSHTVPLALAEHGPF